MNFVKRTRIMDRDQAIAGIANIRKQWEEATEGCSLIEAQASVGMLLGDVVMALNLTSQEQEAALGASLRREYLRT